MNNISLVFSKQKQELQQHILSNVVQKQIDITVFADRSLNLNNNSMCMLPTGNLLSFVGDAICVTPQDVEMVRGLGRDINIKYIIDTTYDEIQNWFDDEDDIEYLTVLEDDRIINLIHSLTGLQNIRTFKEYIL